MSDISDARRRNMSAIRSKDTKPETLIRKALHRDGFRYRVHARNLPGSPDLVLPKYRAVVFVNGCFWHLHECETFRWPKTRAEFWREKLTANRARDTLAVDYLMAADWRVAIVWECSLRPVYNVSGIVDELEQWLRSDSKSIELPGKSA